MKRALLQQRFNSERLFARIDRWLNLRFGPIFVLPRQLLHLT